MYIWQVTALKSDNCENRSLISVIAVSIYVKDTDDVGSIVCVVAAPVSVDVSTDNDFITSIYMQHIV